MSRPIRAVLVCGGRFHDFDYARLELLKHLGADPRVRTRVLDDWSQTDAWQDADLLVTYTCDVRPTPDQAEALARYVESGGRWFALHGTNAILEFDGLKVGCPRLAPRFMQTLGSQFLAHPPIEPYRVTVSDPSHPLVKGIEPFDANDELYLSEFHGPVKTLLETRFSGLCPASTRLCGTTMRRARCCIYTTWAKGRCCISRSDTAGVTTTCGR